MYFAYEDTRTPLSVGTIVEDGRGTRYVIDSVAGFGGFAITYIAHAENSGHYVALKELYPKFLEDAVMERDADGKILVYNPFSDDEDKNAYWDDLLRAFRREAMLTRKASILYNASGDIEDQNHPDTLSVYGPFQDKRTGNRYLAFDTYQGEPLNQFIGQGWQQDSEKGAEPNTNLPEIIDILKKVSLRLSNLHSDGQMYHLDLSPANIYITRQHGGTELHPYLIDYGSAYVRNNRNEHISHRFTCNPYSAPEINALAELNDQHCGYSVDASSDTYAICSMLFYAVLGEVYSTEHCFSNEWELKIRAMYPADIYKSFAEELVGFFYTGLAYGQERRYRTANALYLALDKLGKALHGKGLLAQMDPYTLSAFLSMDRYPLYDYADENKHIDILCLGSGEIADTMLRTIIWCGQMLDYTLNIHVVSQNAEQYRDELLRKTPELRSYSNLGESSEVYVNLFFENTQDVLLEESRKKILEQYGHCRYTVIALGENKRNVEMARLFAADLAEQNLTGEYLIQYAQEDVAQNLRSDVSAPPKVENITLRPFGSQLAVNRHFAKDLGMKAFRLHHLYDKQGTPSINKSKSMENFLRSNNAYGQLSSAASALHMKYKLASIGIKADSDTSIADVVSLYEQQVLGADCTLFNKLLYLEHRRWMMYVITMENFKCPTMEQIDSFCFRNGNYRFRDNKRGYHPCLVPCDQNGIRLENLPKTEWDQYENYEQIDASDYDELDKMSLKLHLLAKQKIEYARPNISAALEMLQIMMLRFFPKQTFEFDNAESILAHFSQQLDDAVNGEISTDAIPYQELTECFEAVGVSIEGEIRQIKDSLRIVEEYQRYHDYKKPDRMIIEQLPWICYADENIELIKLKSDRQVDNICSALLLEPQKMICFGCDGDTNLSRFFQVRGSDMQLLFVPCRRHGFDRIKEELHSIVQSCKGTCIIDITGGDQTIASAASELAAENKNIAIIRSNSAMYQIEEVRNFPYASIYRLPQSLLVSDIYRLFGAEEERTWTHRYLMRLYRYIPVLWKFYLSHKDGWAKLMAFFSTYCRAFSVFYTKIPTPDEMTLWVDRKYSLDFILFKNTKMRNILSQMETEGIIRDLVFSNIESERFVEISLKCPDTAAFQFDRFLAPERVSTYNHYALENVPYVCQIKRDQDAGTVAVSVDPEDLLRVHIEVGTSVVDKTTGEDYATSDIIQLLKALEKENLISLLEITPSRPPKETQYITFLFKDTSIRECLSKAGNLLEAYAWYEASTSNQFDDLAPNFYFKWGNSEVKNELDLVATRKGRLSTLVISCKMAKYNKEHLYEIKYLADRFGVNSKAVIIYSSDMAVEDGKLSTNTQAVVDRAKEMNVYLIDSATLNIPGALGARLVQIADEQTTQ